MELIKKKTYKLFYGGCDMNGDIKLGKLAELFSELADEQVDELTEYYPFLYDKNKRWILVRYHFEIKRLIKAEETFTVSTYQSHYSKFTCIRSYSVNDVYGTQIISADCQWVMIDAASGRICTVPKEYSTLTNCIDAAKKELVRLDDFEIEYEQELAMRYDDYDYNNHVNNTKYFSFITEPKNNLAMTWKNLKRIDINYRQGMAMGCIYKMGILQERNNDEITVFQKFYKGNETSAIMKCVWQLNEVER